MNKYSQIGFLVYPLLVSTLSQMQRKYWDALTIERFGSNFFRTGTRFAVCHFVIAQYNPLPLVKWRYHRKCRLACCVDNRHTYVHYHVRILWLVVAGLHNVYRTRPSGLETMANTRRSGLREL